MSKQPRIKSVFGTVLLIALSFSLFSCTEEKSTYSDRQTCAELMSVAEEQIPVQFGYESYSADQIRFYFEEADIYDDVCIRYSARSEDINEIGIFHSADDDSHKKTEQAVRSYLETLKQDQSAFLASYAAEELPKLENAEVRTFGHYTVYAVLGEEERTLFFETVQKELTRPE